MNQHPEPFSENTENITSIAINAGIQLIGELVSNQNNVNDTYKKIENDLCEQLKKDGLSTEDQKDIMKMRIDNANNMSTGSTDFRRDIIEVGLYIAVGWGVSKLIAGIFSGGKIR